MTNMPTKSQFTGSITNGERKAAEEQMIDFLSQYLPIDGSKLPAENIANTPSGNVISTDLQGVVNEFDGRVGANPSFRNKIINGNFDIWRRATSQTSSGYGSDDKWKNLHVGSTKTHSRQSFTIGQTDVPGNPFFFSRTVVTSVAGASNYVIKEQIIERIFTLSGQTATLSFWAKADTSKNMVIEFVQNFGSGGSPSTSISGIGVTMISLTTSWNKYVITVDIPSISGKILGTDNTDNLSVLFWFDAGSNFNNRTNNLGQQSGTFDIAQVQLEKGYTATPFEQKPISLETLLCTRYYNTSRGTFVVWNNTQYNFGAALNWIYFPPMRAAPSVTIVTGAAGSGWISTNFTTDINNNTLKIWPVTTQTSLGAYCDFTVNLDADL